MSEPSMPLVLIKSVMPADGCLAVSPRGGATIRQSDGKVFPMLVQSVKVTIDWNSGEPITADIKAVGGFAVECATGLRTVEIGGKRYRLQECGPECVVVHDEVPHVSYAELDAAAATCDKIGMGDVAERLRRINLVNVREPSTGEP